MSICATNFSNGNIPDVSSADYYVPYLQIQQPLPDDDVTIQIHLRLPQGYKGVLANGYPSDIQPCTDSTVNRQSHATVGIGADATADYSNNYQIINYVHPRLADGDTAAHVYTEYDDHITSKHEHKHNKVKVPKKDGGGGYAAK
ncbi:MAG: hypothetical protein R2813_12180 [Flavobacteriales bacterium]